MFAERLSELKEESSSTIGGYRILAACGDPGGAAAIIPVLSSLRKRCDFRIQIFAYGSAPLLLTRAELEYVNCESGDEEERWNAYVRHADAAVVLTSTSVNEEEHEKRMIRWARRRLIPSIAVLDSWTGYHRRFGPTAGVFDALPDCIAVMDERARRELCGEGIPESIIRVTGQPAFDALAEKRNVFTEGEKMALRRSIGVGPSDRLVTFISQPITALALQPNSLYKNPGYSEHQVAAALADALESAAAANHRPIVLVTRPHPREVSPPLPRSTHHVRCMVIRDGSTHDWMMASDLVVGMSSIALVESCLLGCLTLSLQPNAIYEDTVASNRAGISKSVRAMADIPDAVNAMLFDNETRKIYRQRMAAWKVDGLATKRIEGIVEEMLRGT